MTSPQPTPGTFCWFECGSTDAAAARRFYTALFGWDAVDVPMPGDMAGNYTMLKMKGADIAGLYQLSGEHFKGVPSHWMTYVTVDDVDETSRRTRELGGQILQEPSEVPGVGRMASLQDPTGAVISLFEPGQHPGSAQLGTAPGSFGWSELATRDPKVAEAFYTQLLPWSAKTDQGPMPYTEFQVGGRSIAGMMEMKTEHGDAPPHWLPYVMVADCRATAEKVTELGGCLLVLPTDIPNVGCFAVFMDPAGAALAVIQMSV